MTKPELLAPIQDFTSLRAAIASGADAVYFGIRGFNMRAGAKNFEVKDLKKITKLCHQHKIKAYLALNTIVFDAELKPVEKILKQAKLAQIDAVICWDMAVVALAKKLGLTIHLSTQASVANSQALAVYKKLGVKRVILARECSLEDIKNIKHKIHGISRSARNDIQLEIFIHGAMCVSLSGRCFLSQFLYNQSANRGACLQPCRRKYLIKQIDYADSLIDKTGDEFELGENYVLSPKDLCTLPFIEKLIEAGVDSFKIEGRNRSPEYVATVTRVYRQAIDFYFSVTPDFSPDSVRAKARSYNNLKEKLMQELKTVYHRGFSNGFYLGQPMHAWTQQYGSLATRRKIHIGKVVHYYPRIKVAEILIEAQQTLKLKDKIIIQGEQTGVVEQTLDSMEIEHQSIKKAGQKSVVAIKVIQSVRKGDGVYKTINR